MLPGCLYSIKLNYVIIFINNKMCSLKFFIFSAISCETCNIFHKGKFKTDKLLLIEKRVSLKSNYITAYQTYLQYFRQNLSFAPIPSYLRVVSDVLFGENSSISTSSSNHI